MPLRGSPVISSGVGAVTALGHDCQGLFSGILDGRSGIDRIRRFDTSPFQVHLGAEVRRWPPPPGSDLASGLCHAFAVRAGREALAAAKLHDPSRLARTSLLFGTGLIDGVLPIHQLAERIAADLGLGGGVLVVSTACTSSAGAIGLARDVLAMGGADHVLAGGADVLTESVFAGFYALGVLSRSPCAPFSRPFGTTLGEGAGFMVLEARESAEARGATPVAALAGYGLSSDAFHETSPDPGGGGVARAVNGALRDAGLEAGDIGYVNLHGTGTEANDPAEWRGLRKALNGAPGVPVSSTKGALGHTQGAAGVLESIVTVLAMKKRLVPPTLNFSEPRRTGPADPVGGSDPRAVRYRNALCTNSAFGGSNTALVWSRPDVARPSRSGTRHAVLISGLGILRPGGAGVGQDPGSEPLRASGSIPPFDVRDYVPRTDPRGLDPSSRFLIAATALALRDGGIRLRGSSRDTTGLLVGAIRASPESVRGFSKSIEERGLPGLSAAAFARMVLNAAAGSCAKAHSIRGPLTVVACGAGSGLAALVLSAELLATRQDLLRMIAAAVDERDPLSANPDREREAATAVVLERSRPEARRDPAGDCSRRPLIRLSGWSLAGPGRGDEAVDLALSMAGLSSADVDQTFEGDEIAGSVDLASPSALALARAAIALRNGKGGIALVTSRSGGCLSAAAVLHAA